MPEESKQEKQNKVKAKHLSTALKFLTQIMRKVIILEFVLPDDITVVHSI